MGGKKKKDQSEMISGLGTGYGWMGQGLSLVDDGRMLGAGAVIESVAMLGTAAVQAYDGDYKAAAGTIASGMAGLAVTSPAAAALYALGVSSAAPYIVVGLAGAGVVWGINAVFAEEPSPVIFDPENERGSEPNESDGNASTSGFKPDIIRSYSEMGALEAGMHEAFDSSMNSTLQRVDELGALGKEYSKPITSSSFMDSLGYSHIDDVLESSPETLKRQAKLVQKKQQRKLTEKQPVKQDVLETEVREKNPDESQPPKQESSKQKKQSSDKKKEKNDDRRGKINSGVSEKSSMTPEREAKQLGGI